MHWHILWQIKLHPICVLCILAWEQPRSCNCVVFLKLFLLCLFRYVAIPLAKALGIKNVRRVKPQPNPVLESYFRECSRQPSQVRILILQTRFTFGKSHSYCFNQLSAMTSWDEFQLIDRWLNLFGFLLLFCWQGYMVLETEYKFKMFNLLACCSRLDC